MVTGCAVRRGVAVLAALSAVAWAPGAVGTASAADGAADLKEVPRYTTAPDATPVNGRASAADAPEIGKGTYTDSIERGEQKYYTVPLDARSTAYFSVVAAPPPGTKVEDHTDRLKISVQNVDGTLCDREADPAFRGGGTAYPIADYATRGVDGDSAQCRNAGAYYLVVTREGSATSGPQAWPIEITHLSEPGLKGAAPTTPAESSQPSATPAPPASGTKRKARGGSGFHTAGAVGTGLWKDRIRPGESRFYRVPVDWGQRLNLSAELPNAATGTAEGVFKALGVTAYNPARGVIDEDTFVRYDGRPAASKLFTAPVSYGNRFAVTDDVRAMRVAGWYYLEVTLHPDAARFFPDGADVTLRVDVRGAARSGPGYAGPAGDFSVTPGDRETAEKGLTGEQAGGGNLRTLGYAGIATGAVLLAVLAAWTLLARRTAVAAVTAPALSPQAHAAEPTRSGPRAPGTPPGWPDRR
ncbi:hypothetical protein [Streptomyces benahoarensis]|uniref:hypothetical protein n=1 Tax=Streptomyces benahoarensis TaxID=2595054 RepID=UPI00163DA0A6|nr:hypothetical protein [Streptomyces benahoarensis]